MQFAKSLLTMATIFIGMTVASGPCHSDADCPPGKHCRQQGEFPNIKSCQ